MYWLPGDSLYNLFIRWLYTDETTDTQNKTKPQQPHQITAPHQIITWEWEDICAYRSIDGIDWHRLPGHQGIRFANTSNIDLSQAAIAPGPTDSALHIGTGAELPPPSFVSPFPFSQSTRCPGSREERDSCEWPVLICICPDCLMVVRYSDT